VPPARLFDETLKLFLTGTARRSLEVLQRAGCWRAAADGGRYLQRIPTARWRAAAQGLVNTDQRVRRASR
jgi:tRNA nucleotidyltransferase/poly(A) polymerase